MARKNKRETVDLELVEKYAALGLTDEEIGSLLNVTERTINRWKKDPAFMSVLKKGKLKADSEVVHKLYTRCEGYDYKETTYEPTEVVTRLPDGKVMRESKLAVSKVVTKHVSPDVAACFIWLKNRRGWKNEIGVPDVPKGKRLIIEDSV